MYTSTNIRFARWYNQGVMHEYPEYDKPFVTVGSMEEGAYKVEMTDTNCVVILNGVGRVVDKAEAVEHLEEIYGVAAEGWEHSIEAFVCSTFDV